MSDALTMEISHAPIWARELHQSTLSAIRLHEWIQELSCTDMVRRKKELAAYWLTKKKRGRDQVFSSHPRRRLPCSRFSVRGNSCDLPFSAGAMPLEYWFRHSLGEFHVCFAALALKPD